MAAPITPRTWSHFPAWAQRCDAFRDLTEGDRFVYVMLWLNCSRWGRGEAHPDSVDSFVGRGDRESVRGSMKRLAGSGLITVYRHDRTSYYEIDGFEEDAPVKLISRRGTSKIPDAKGNLSTDARGVQGGHLGHPQGTPKAPLRGTVGVQRERLPLTRESLEPRVQSLELREEKTAMAPPPLTPKLPHWPPGCEEAARMYLYRQEQVAATAMISDAMLINVATDWPDEFSSAVKRIVSLSGEKGKAAFTRNPEKWLRLRCGWIKEDKAKAKKEGTDKPREQAGDAPKPFRGTDCHWYKPKDETRQMREIPPAELLPNLAIMSLKGETKQRRPPTPVTSFPEGLKYWEDHGREFYQSCHDKWIAKGSKPHVPFDDGRSAVAS